MKTLNIEKVQEITGGSMLSCDFEMELIAFDIYNDDDVLLWLDTSMAAQDGCFS